MRETIKVRVLGRRDVLAGLGAGGGLLALASRGLAAGPGNEPAPSVFEAALDKVIGDAKPIAGKITLEIPEIAENGNTVPYAITIDSPMTEAEHVKAIHVLSTANPLAEIATFRLSTLSGKAAVASRMRLAKTQDVVILAELSTSKFLITKRTVKVTIGGCGG